MQEATIIKEAQKSASEKPAKKSAPKNPGSSPQRPGRGLATAAFIVACFTLILSLVNAWYSLILARNLDRIGFSSFTSGFVSDGNSANFVEGSIADVANRVAPSVVSIITETKTTGYNWFMMETESTGAAAGTGIIVSSDGYVMTNKHVIESATKIYIVLDDGTVYKDVELIATDPLNDVAYLRIPDVSGLTAATLGDSKTISIGEQVIAIGNALGQYQNTVTSGIVSGTGRALTATDASYQNAETLTDMIQTDAAINSGNSGGPLVNAAGEVIGINTAVSSGNNIGFAIPISAVRGMLDSLLETGKASRAYAGVSYLNIDASTAIENDYPVSFGAYVQKVISGSPAESAGLKKGDIIVAVNNIKIGANSSLSTLLGEHKVGDTVVLTVRRDDAELNLSLTLTEYKE